MKYEMFLLKYGEIGIKGKNKHIFEEKLVSRVAKALKGLGSFNVYKVDGRVYAKAVSDYDYKKVTQALQRVFGIIGICPVYCAEVDNIDELSKHVKRFWEEEVGDVKTTFKVNTRRSRKSFHLNSMQVNCELGGVILDSFQNTSVDVHHPEIMLNIEVREKIFIYLNELKGAGGMPVGTSQRGMLLLSGGIDSPVAAYLMSKRGMPISATYFHAPPYTSERAKQKVIDLARIVSRYCGNITLNIINFTDIQLAIYEKCPHEELTIIMRRYMMRLAEDCAKEQGAQALITGESVGQVASQTVEGLYCTNEVCNMPVFRPLIAFDKQEIVELAQKIGTFETSILPYEDCCTIFVAKHPVTKPKLEKIKASEKKLNEVIDELYTKALTEREILRVE